MSYLNFISCATCHGTGTAALFEGLKKPPMALSRKATSPYFAHNRDHSSSTLQAFQNLITEQWADLHNQQLFQSHEKWGLIFASTKGRTEDWVWQDSLSQQDPYIDILLWMENNWQYPVEQSVVVSNACTSSHGAIQLAQLWLQLGDLDHVLIVAGDLIGPFTLKGFQSLRALSETECLRPFDRNRDGLLLGDALATAVISQNPRGEQPVKLHPVQSLCEGVSATRPDTTGKNLARCFQTENFKPEVLIAHGTATQYNDMTEANAIQQAFSQTTPPWITTTKWSVGHSLGASGLVDLAAAKEILRQQVVPGIPTLKECDLAIDELVLRNSQSMAVDHILISSLGFGGMCSALPVSRGDRL